ncbi:hypothetical protein [Streptomyces sp. MNU77]|uniref:hypothetical protein n=1 Tax=Streptomyces sp. MNU77 TaxID=1573406 RepID=UPI00117FC0F8|nr:hypothetical protein [Streptomyces sp. MNU77]
MTTPDSDPQPVRGPDSDKIDRIAAYVDDQNRGADGFFAQWGKFSALLAVLAFLFGVTTYSEIRERFFSPDPIPTSQERYERLVGATCTSRIRADMGRDKLFFELFEAAAHDQKIMELRQGMSLAFNTSFPDDLPEGDRASLNSAFLYYESSNAFLRAAIGSAKADDENSYAVNIGLYKQSSAAFSQATREAGIPACGFYWGVAVTSR